MSLRAPRHTGSISTLIPSIYTHCPSCFRRDFSSTPQSQTRLRRRMFAWLNGPGESFRHPLPNSTNYLSAYDKRGKLIRENEQKHKSPTGPGTSDSQALEDAATEPQLEKESREDLRPFPLNLHFVSESVLSEALRLEIWRRVQVEKRSIRQVSVELSVEMRRVGAVVRLVELERRMKSEGTLLALPYARAIHSMVPTTPYDPKSTKSVTPHESINDLPSHPLTDPQIFYPTSESRSFNRIDAGRVFSAAPRLPDDQDIGQGGTPEQEAWEDKSIEIIGKAGQEMPVLKPADSRIPHPQLIAFEKDKKDPHFSGDRSVRMTRYNDRLSRDQKDREEAKSRREAIKEENTKRVESSRWQFIVTNVRTTRSGTGLDGRGDQSPGYRYGVPSHDRKKGHVTIPTSVRV